MKQWYEELFTDYAGNYDRENYTRGTIGECDFIENEMGHDRGAKILDIGCGTGRHSLELARRGYEVVGIDLSESQLRRAREKAAAQNVRVDFRRHDARDLPFSGEFDLAVMLCEGAFPLMETDEMNYRILEGAARALKPGSKFIFTTLNGLFPLFHSVKEFLEKEKGEGGSSCEESSFDLMTFRDRNLTSVVDDLGNKKELRCNERYYVPCEITWLLTTLGFKQIGIFGAKLGAFSRGDKLTADDFEMLVVSEKQEGPGPR
jgi:ubiquinone/menaquinone biosynthesis C-methylase UbiE